MGCLHHTRHHAVQGPEEAHHKNAAVEDDKHSTEQCGRTSQRREWILSKISKQAAPHLH